MPATTTTSTWVEGTLVIDLYKAANKKLLWRGVATDTLSDNPQKKCEEDRRSGRKDVQEVSAGSEEVRSGLVLQ
jgi:hypothetical protein